MTWVNESIVLSEVSYMNIAGHYGVVIEFCLLMLLKVLFGLVKYFLSNDRILFN